MGMGRGKKLWIRCVKGLLVGKKQFVVFCGFEGLDVSNLETRNTREV